MWIRRWLGRRTLGEDLKAMRLGKKLSRRRLAQRSGVSERTISRVENGTGTINVLSVILLALALGERPDKLWSTENISLTHLRELQAASQKAAERFRRRLR